MRLFFSLKMSRISLKLTSFKSGPISRKILREFIHFRSLTGHVLYIQHMTSSCIYLLVSKMKPQCFYHHFWACPGKTSHTHLPPPKLKILYETLVLARAVPKDSTRALDFIIEMKPCPRPTARDDPLPNNTVFAELQMSINIFTLL